MKTKIILPLILLIVNVSLVNSGMASSLLDNSISFLENLRRLYRRYVIEDNNSTVSQNTKVNSDITEEEEDRYLQLVGDGSVFSRVQRNKSFDGGLTYLIIDDFVPASNTKRPSYTRHFYDVILLPNKTTEDEEGEDPFTRKPAEKIGFKTTEPSIIYPTDRAKIYPSNKDGTYGFVVQLTHANNPLRFTRPRGKEVYYFNKVGRDIIFTNVVIPIKNNEKKLPPDITTVFKGPDGLYYFIREDAYCRRPLNVSGIGLDPPDYCPEGGDLRELLGCNIRFYPPEVDDLCNNPNLDHSFLAPDGKTAWLIRGKDVWLLHNLPSNPKAAPSKCNMTKHGDVTKIWKRFNTKAEALFVAEEQNKTPLLVAFYKHKFTVWNFKGGNPLYESFIKEMPLNENQYKNLMFTEAPVEVAPVETVHKPKSKIVYTEKEFKELCDEPTIDSADSSLDGTIVYLFKNDRYYQLEGVKEQGYGKLTKTGKTTELLKGFSKSSSAVMTCKEGRNRGLTYEFNTFYDKNTKKSPHTQFTSWDIDGQITTMGEQWIEPSAAGLVAAFHNRNVTDPVMIALKDDEVFYYSTIADTFAPKRRSVKHFDSREKLPAGVSAAFSMPNQIIYLFKDKHFCVRELFYNRNPPYCPEWQDSRELFGCFGNPNKAKPPSEKKLNDFKAMKDLCSDLKIDDADRTWQREDMIFVWRKDKFWRLADFPRAPRVVESGITAKKFDGFSDSPDAVSIIQEGRVRRGGFFSTYGGYWSSWYPDRKPWVGYKAWWGQPASSRSFGAMMHNGDIKKPLVLGFEGSDVQYYSSEGSLLNHKGGARVEDTEEHWPTDITAAFRMEDNTVYLFRGDKYCHRNWKCSDKAKSCVSDNCVQSVALNNHKTVVPLKCDQWKEAKELFKCDSIGSYSVDGSDSVVDEDYSGNGRVDEATTHATVGKGDTKEGGEVSTEAVEYEYYDEETTTKMPEKKKIIKNKKNRLKPDEILPTPRE